MECYDRAAAVHYPRHEEWVVPRGAGATNLGVCVRCGEITDLRVCVLSARQGYGRSADALVRAGLMTPARYDVRVVCRRSGKGQSARVVATYDTREAAEERARDESRPLSPEERDDGWLSASAEVVEVGGQFLGAAQRLAT